MIALMDDWHRKLAGHFVAHAPTTALDEQATALEAAFGRARGATAYVLELARAHRIPAAGGIVGDDIWIELGDDRARFTLNRRAAYIAIRTDHEERRLKWDDARAAIVDTLGTPSDVERIAQAAIETVVERWRASPAAATFWRVPPQPEAEREEETTKG